MADFDARDNEFEETVVQINRITKVVKGGRRLRFAAVVVVLEPVRPKKFLKQFEKLLMQLRKV